MTHPVAFTDCETSGLLRDVHEPWEVGLILPGGYEHHWLLPIDIARADPIALDVGGYHRRHPHGNAYQSDPYRGAGPTAEPDGYQHGLSRLDKFAEEYAALTHGLHLAGAVVDFDADMIRRVLRAQNRTPSWHYHLIDVEARAAGFILGREVEYDLITGRRRWKKDHSEQLIEWATPPYDSEKLSEAVGVEVTRFERHTALGDARWAMALYEACS